jgi:O-antigen ligase
MQGTMTIKRLRVFYTWGILIVPMVAFFLPLDLFLIVGSSCCLLMILDVKTFWEALVYQGSYWFMVFTVDLIGLSVIYQNFLGLLACGFLLLIVIYFTVLRYVMTPLLMEVLTWIVGLGSILSLFYTTIDFYGPNTIALYQFFIDFIPLGFSFVSGMVGDPNPASTFISSNFYGHISAVIALISVAMMAESIKSFRSAPIISSLKIAVLTVIVGANLVALDLTLSWSAHLGLVAGLMVFALVWDWRWFLAISSVVLIIGLVQSPWILAFFPPLDDWVSTANYRFGLYRAAWAEILKTPWFGRGLYTFPTIVEAYGTGYQVHSHNLILEFLLSAGIGGVILFGMYLKAVLGQSIRHWKAKDHPRMALLWGMVALELANGMTDAVIVFPQSFVLFCLVILMVEGTPNQDASAMIE